MYLLLRKSVCRIHCSLHIIVCVIILIGNAEAKGWLDFDMYEAFIPSYIQLNETVMTFNLTMTQYFRYLVNCNSDCVISDVSFHLQSSFPYFYLASKNPISLNFLNNQKMFVPIMTESVDLLSAVDGHIPLNDYKMKIEVFAGDTSLLGSDIVIHVVDSLPSLPVPG